MARRRKRMLLMVAVGLLVVWMLLFSIRFFTSRHDYRQVLQGREPTFARQISAIADGGTVGYRGLGYDLTAWHSFHVENAQVIGHDMGPELTYRLNWLLLPLSNKKEIRFEPMNGLQR